MKTHMSLFSGIGGLDLAAEHAGFTTVAQCEWADYPTRVLEKHWPDVPRWRDIHDLTGEDFRARTGLRTVDVISGGFPCQPFSVAGKQAGKEDERYLWPEMLRVIGELKPRFVVGENVPGILRIAAEEVVQSLEREGYHVVVFDFEAASTGAPHRRERVFFVAEHDDGIRCGKETRAAGIRPVVSDAEVAGLEGRSEHSSAEQDQGSGETVFAECHRSRIFWGDWWAVEPDVGRVVHGIPNRVDRLRCLGNAVVPKQAYPVFKAIMEVLE